MIGFILGNICNFTLSFIDQQPVRSGSFIVLVVILYYLLFVRLIRKQEVLPPVKHAQAIDKDNHTTQINYKNYL